MQDHRDHLGRLEVLEIQALLAHLVKWDHLE